jgi:hypothetical protein
VWTIVSNAPNTLDARRLSLRRDASRVLYRASRAVDVDVMLTSIGRTLDLQSAPGLEAPRKEVNDGAAGIRQFLNERNLVNKEARQSQYQEFEKTVNSLLEKSEHTSDLGEMGKIESKLFEVDNKSLMSGLGERMFSLQESLLALTRQAIDVKPAYTIMWDEKSGQVIYREDIIVTSRQDALLTEIDASLLKREADNTNTPFKLWVSHGGNQKEEVSDPSHILIEPKAKQAVLQYERFAPQQITPYCNCAPLSTIQRILFTGPVSGDSVRLGATLASGDVRLPAWFTVDRSKNDTQFVREILLPEYSFFAARQPLQFVTQDEHDVLTPGSEKTMTSIASFGPDQRNWVEVLQKKWLLRKAAVSKHREYFVLENSVSAVVALILGGLVGAIFPSFEKKQES